MKVHGLNNDWVEPDWPFLTLPEINKLLRRFPEAGRAERLLSYSPRPFSAASVVATKNGRLFVKRHHESVRNREELLEEHRLLRYLREHGIPVPLVLADAAGETAVRDAPWTYEVHSFAAGVDLYERELSWTPFRSRQQARSAGRALARLHAATGGYSAPPRKARTLVASFSIFAAHDARRALEQYVHDRPAVAEHLAKRDWRSEVESTLMPYHAGLRRWLDSLRPLWTHNDFHASNLFWSSERDSAEVQSIVDFGLADRTNAVHDLAIAIERNSVRWLSPQGSFDEVVHLDQIGALLEGYEEIRPLSREEVEALPAMLPLVHAEFALSEVDYFVRILKSENRASLSWDGYLLGHAAWFGSENGKLLLDYLAARANDRCCRQREQRAEDVCS